ncbi:predicted protein [Arabidopsis lyrata subsp. lyrata]|uniref:Wall-associated receptor kinase-like n=1 Tax=Arabidopsis lyrata subsp. lyrata TaxID=81972 RepID=D7L155_ARALL|nr:predicted protein [Arabidopsis lyrata subsp. lyrata]
MSSNTSCSLLSLLFLLLLLILDSADLTVSSYCLRNCGGIKIPYPFGIGMGCYLEHSYEIECVNSSSIPGKLVPFLSAIGKEVVNISSPQVITSSYVGLEDGSVRIKNKITSKGCSSDGEEHVSLLNLTGTPFYVGRNNILIASGCNNMASLTNVEPIMVGCKSSCSATNRTASKDYLAELSCDKFCSRTNETIFNQKGCNGFQCCEANMPTQIQQIVGVRIDSTTTTGGCKVAFLTDEEYSFLNGSDPKRLHAKGTSTVELGWFIHTSNRSYVDSLGCQSYETMSRLKREGYNAYETMQDAHAMTVTKATHTFKEEADAKGHYECEYKKHRPLAIGFGSSFGSLIFIVGIYWLYKFMRKQKRLKQKKKFFKRNGGLLLQQQLTATEGNVEKTKVFTSRELEKATENFNLNRILGQGGQGTVYKGMLGDGRIVAVKKSKVVDEDKLEEFINEVVILSQINHRNIVKLLGCCLETDVPVLVYEFIPNGNLFEHLHDELEDYTMTTWEVRLRIAVDIAEALSYLHSAASSPIYHRDVKSTNIMLDEKYRAKVSDFGTSRSVTVDHTHLTTVGRKRPSMREVSMELEKIRSSSGDMQPDEYVSENEEEREEGVVEVNIKVESWNNVAVTAPTYQCNNAASSSLWSDVEPLFPLQTL